MDAESPAGTAAELVVIQKHTAKLEALSARQIAVVALVYQLPFAATAGASFRDFGLAGVVDVV